MLTNPSSDATRRVLISNEFLKGRHGSVAFVIFTCEHVILATSLSGDCVGSGSTAHGKIVH